MNDAYDHTDRLYDENHYIDLWLKNLGSSPVQQNNTWDEERIDIIGQNGNEGLHYTQSVEYYPPGLSQEYPPNYTTDRAFLDKLINDHWKYIEGVLDKAGTYPTALAEIEYHYRTAFAHGWKHAVEYYAINS